MGRLNEEQVLELIGRLGGNVSAIARACSVNRTAMINYIERRPNLLHAVQDARAAVQDDARSILARQVKLALRTVAPDALNAKGDYHAPRFTNAERLELLRELIESVQAEQVRSDPDGPPAKGQ